ncbi:MAG: hypothetical protein LAP86_03825 [Acidobacteriia bacterium]|nr:hypothetical protein [Terriglobia bacterium]
MSLRNHFILPVILSSIAVLAACGGGSSNPPVNPPPSGSFSNSNLNGNYVFSVTGTAADQFNDFVTIMGVFTADGNGNITGGVLDQNSTASNGLILDTITSGTYSVGSDGRPTGSPSLPAGLLTLQTQNSGTFQFDYVLTSSTHGLVTQFETFGSASGTLDAQSAVTQANINGNSYAFNFTGSSGFDTVFCNLNAGGSVVIPYATVGAFTLDSSGHITGGVEDFNNNCFSSGATNVAVTGGGITLGQGFGTATITSGSGASAVTYTFDVFPIDATHLKFIETDALPVLVGDAFTQTSSIPTGNNVFTVAGFDNASNVMGPFTAAGLLHADGSGTIVSDSVQDVNDFGVASTVNFTGTYTALTGGRAELTLTGFINGNDGLGCSACVFAVYPSSGGLQMLEIDDAGSTNGIAYPQTATTLASGEGYGMNLSGLFVTANSGSSEDDIAEFTNNNGHFNGIIDFNDQGSTSFKNTFSSTYAADATVSGRGTVTPGRNGYDLTTYVVDSSTAVVVSTEANVNDAYIALGAFVKQNASAQSNVVASHLTTLRVNASPRAKSARKGTPHTRPTNAPRTRSK